MKKITICLYVLLLTVSSSCRNSEEIDRNIINFKGSKDTVERSLLVMNRLMDKILPNKGEMHNYFFDARNDFYINSKRIGKIDSLRISSSEVFRELTTKEMEEFIAQAIFLKNNHLSSVFQDKSCKCYLYDYHQVDDPSFKNNRLIYLNEEDKDYSTILIEREILDKTGNLILIGVK